MRKIISLILCAVLILPAFAAPCAAAREDGGLLDEYKTLLAAIEVTDEEPESITRGVFLTAVMRLLRLDGSGTPSDFNDIPDGSELAYAAKTAAGLGIIAQSNSFYPEREITYPEAYKMLVCALGYGAYAQSKGGYPAGTNAAAATLKFAKNTDSSTGAVGTDDFYILLGNAARAKYMEPSGFSGDVVSYGKSRTLLEVKYDIVELDGIYEANEDTYLNDNRTDSGKNRTVIDGVTYEGKIDGILLGSRVRAYVREDGTDSELVCAVGYNNEYRSISSVRKPELDAGKLYYDNKSSRSSYKTDADAAVVYNGKALVGYTAADFAIDDGELVLVDNDGDGSYDVVHIRESKYLTVGNIAEKVIYDKNHSGRLDLSKDDAKYEILSGGEVLLLENLAADDCIEYYVSRDGLLASVYVLAETAYGDFKSVDTTEKTAFLGDVEYDMTQYFIDAYLNEVKLGSNVTAYLSSDGKLVAVSGAAADTMLYGYLYGIFNDVEASENSVGVRLFGEDGALHTYYVSDKLVLNGSRSEPEDTYTKFYDSPQLIRYKIKNSVISKINTEQPTMGIYDRMEEDADILKRWNFEGYDTSDTVYYKITGYFVPHFTITNATRIFCINNYADTNEKKYTLAAGLGFLSNDSKVEAKNIIPYNVSPTGVAKALLYIGKSNGSVEFDSRFGVVKKVKYELDEDDEKVIGIELWSEDSFSTYKIKTDEDFLQNLRSSGEYSDSEIPFAIGDALRYTVDSFGYITNMQRDFDNKNKTLFERYGRAAKDNDNLKYYYGGLYDVDSSAIALFDIAAGANGRKWYFPWGSTYCCIVDEDNKVYTVPRGNMVSYLNNEAKYSRVLIKTRYASVQAVIVYE